MSPDDVEIHELLKGKDIASIAKYMKSKHCKNAGAGISTSAGIPDFRSPKTGQLHRCISNLAKLNLPFPEAVFEINFFRKNPVPFYTLAHELAPGKFRPTLTHSFIRLLSEKGLLHTHFTQNIDTLERRAGVPDEDIIEAHGSFATQRCIDCGEPYDGDEIKRKIKGKEIPYCNVCQGLVKPDIVFYGEGLPDEFHLAAPSLKNADLLFVMGTSLTVHPFAGLTRLVPRRCPRVLVNLELAGDIGSRTNDVTILRECDIAVRELAQELGWEEDLDKLWEETANSVETESTEDPSASAAVEEEEEEHPVHHNEIERLSKTLESALNLTRPDSKAGDSPVEQPPALDEQSTSSPKSEKESDTKEPEDKAPETEEK
ncbi:Sir2 family histone deacetylase Hst2 [Sistotremastrum niveocremeum HHB9708]|uniref:NAD-dependent protein deacetylase n=1 Tax=Sistotremastrum niveocremeum HHB9708 TaxID=1314777 RepID=A0A164U3Z1_9AGAM|nr:Sir2 family histone deacetylase Hst2 [Sistotremastrum niveocremeum HHB9708]